MVDVLAGGDGFDRADMEGVLDLIGELPDLWDFQTRRLGGRLRHVAVRRGGRPGGVRARPQAADDQAGRRRRALHVGRHDGADGARRDPRPHRCGAAVDRRPVPAREDRGRALRRHLRVHRLQHLRLRRCHDRRRSAAPRTRPWARSGAAAGIRSASGRRRRTRPCWSSARARPGSRRRTRSASGATTVVLAEAERALGGRVELEARLPGLAAWIRVLDYRARQIDRLRERRDRAREQRRPPTRSSPTTSTMSRSRRVPAGAATVSVAGIRSAIPIAATANVLTPDDLLDGARPAGNARRPLRRRPLLHGRRPGRAARAGGARGHPRHTGCARLGVVGQHHGAAADPAAPARARASPIETSTTIARRASGPVQAACAYTERERELACDAVVLVTARLPKDELHLDLVARARTLGRRRASPPSTAIGDAWSPARSPRPSGKAGATRRSSTALRPETTCRSGARSSRSPAARPSAVGSYRLARHRASFETPHYRDR